MANLKSQQTLLIPFDFFGSWVLISVQQTHATNIQIVGLDNVIQACVMWLWPYLQEAKLNFNSYPEEVTANQTSLYVLWLISEICQDKLVIDTISQLPFVEESVVAPEVRLPTLDEQAFGNPYVDTWMSLHVQSVLALYYDDKRNALSAVPSQVIERTMQVVKQLGSQLQLLTRMQHPQLYYHLFTEYREALVEFDENFAIWLDDAARQIEKEENSSIRQKLLEAEGVVSPFTEHLFGAHIQPKTNYAGSGWFNTGFRKYVDINSKGHVTGTSQQAWSFGYGNQPGFTNTYLGKPRKDSMQNIIQGQVARIEAQRLTLNAQHYLISAICDNGEVGFIPGIHFPQILIPKDNQFPYLAAPLYLETVIPEELARAYQVNCIKLRFIYEIIREKFIIHGEWTPVEKNDPWLVFSSKEYVYEPLFYEGAEAVFNYWYGGNMPQSLTANGYTEVWCSGGFSGVTRLHDNVYIPAFSERKAAINQDFREKPEILDTLATSGQLNKAKQIFKEWQESLTSRLAEAFISETSNLTTPLAKSMAKLDKSLHLLQTYLNTLAFAHQDDDLYFAIQEQFSQALFDSEAMQACFSDPSEGVVVFKEYRPTIEKIALLEEWVMSSIKNLPSMNLHTTLATASCMLHQVLQERTVVRRQPNLKHRMNVLDSYIMSMRSQVESVFRNSGDLVHAQALANSLNENAGYCARLGGQLDAVQTSEHQDLKILIENQYQLQAQLRVLDNEINRVRKLVRANVLSQESLKYLCTQQSILRNYYNRIEYQLGSAAEEFDTVYYAHDYIPQPLGIINRQELPAKTDALQSQRITYLANVQEITKALADLMGIPFEPTIDLLKQLNLYMHDAIVDEAVVLVGRTKTGKSTSLNFIKGCLYESFLGDDGVIRRKLISGDEYVAVGQNIASETKFPSIQAITGKPYVLIDMPGFNDNRETTNEAAISPWVISTAMSIYWLAKRVNKVRALFVYVPHAELIDINFSSDLKLTMQTVGRMILEHPEAADNIKLLITQYESINMARILARLRALSNSEQAKEDPALLAFFSVFKANPEQKIKFFDVVDPNFRQEIYAMLDDLKPRSAQDFDFEHCSKHLDRFKDLLEQFTESSEKLKARINSLDDEVSKFDSSVNREVRTDRIIQAFNTQGLPHLADSTSMSGLLDVQRSLMAFLDNMEHINGLSSAIENVEEQFKENNERQINLQQLRVQLDVEESYYHELGVLPCDKADTSISVVRHSQFSIFKSAVSENNRSIPVLGDVSSNSI